MTTVELPQPDLRFVKRDGKRILQQRWIIKVIDAERRPVSVTPEWRDVPLVEGV